MKIRKATKKDFEKYFPLKIEESREYEKVIGKKMKIPSKTELKKEFLDFISQKNKSSLIGEYEKEIIAYMNFTIYENLWSQGGYIEDIFVKKGFRKKGVATKLINEFSKQLKSKKINQIILSVNVKNKNAIKLYKKLGFGIIKYEMKKRLK